MIVRTVARLSVWLILFYSLYITLSGHLSLGGGFAGGVIAALALVLNILAYGRPHLDFDLALQLTGWGALLFLATALLGYLKGAFFANFLPLGIHGTFISGGTIPLLNLFLFLEVGAGLLSVFIILVGFKVSAREEEK